MRKTFLTFALFLIVSAFFTGCEKTNDMLIGKWKLECVKITTDYQEWDTINYLNENIIYDFQKNSKLIITGNIPDDFYVFKDFQAGKHTYTYHYHDDCPNCKPNFFKIDGKKNYKCSPPIWGMDLDISGEKKFDGTTFYWVKVFVKI